MREAFDYLEYAAAEAIEHMSLLSICLSPTVQILLGSIMDELTDAMNHADRLAGLWEED